MTCHMHPGTLVLNSYLGYMWWDNESDGAHMYPKDQKYPSADTHFAVHQHNPEGSATRGLWSNQYPDSTDHHGVPAGSGSSPPPGCTWPRSGATSNGWTSSSR